MRRIDSLLIDYASYHQTRGNLACHFVGIPLIIFGLFSVLSPVALVNAGPFEITAAEVLLIVSLTYYFSLDAKLTAGMLLSSIVLDAAAHAVGDARIGFAALVVGWIFQAIGHSVYEKKSPAFFRNLIHLLVGPVFLLNELLHIRDISRRGEALVTQDSRPR